MDKKTIETNVGSEFNKPTSRKVYSTPQLVSLGDDLVQSGSAPGDDGTGFDTAAS